MNNEVAPDASPDTSKENFNRRRATKNKVTLAIIFGCVALIWALTMIKMQHGG